jgi:hypothetical protein
MAGCELWHVGVMVAAVTEAPERIKAKPGCKPKQKRVNYALAATLLHQGVTLAEIALQVGAANAESLRCGLARKGVTLKQIRNAPMAEERVTSVTARIASDASEIIRQNIGNRLLDQVSHLSKRKVGHLANAGQGEAAVLKTLAETHRTLYGGAETNITIFGAETMNFQPAQQSQVVKQESQEVIDLPGDNPA